MNKTKVMRNKPFKSLLVTSVMALSLFGGTLSPLSVALAAPCTGFGCDHVSPDAGDGCGTRSTKRSTTIYWQNDPSVPIATLELRYSAECDTAWSRITLNDGTFDPYNSKVTVWRKNTGHVPPLYNSDTRTDLIYAGAQNWSRMLYIPPSSTDTYSVKVCADLDSTLNGVGSDGSACTVYWTGI